MPTVDRTAGAATTSARRQNGDLAYSLGGWSGRKDRAVRLIDKEKEKWKPNTAVLKAVIKFVKAIL